MVNTDQLELSWSDVEKHLRSVGFVINQSTLQDLLLEIINCPQNAVDTREWVIHSKLFKRGEWNDTKNKTTLTN